VAFEQLYYTSCERGVGGYAGFQFNALSQGAGAGIMRQVEQLTVYELPSWDTSPADAPVNLCHVHDAARGGDITACVVYAGADFSGRSGNYFAHALVTENPARDFGGLLPVELWESPVWARTPVDGTVLPTIQAAPPRGSFDRPAVAEFLAAQDDAQPVLARLLSAADQALGGGRPLVLWSPTSTDNAHWIAAISYLLGDARAREMSFYTYTRRPAQCRAHVIGTVPGVVTSPAALADGFRVFDMAARTLPDVATHPAAVLLAQVGVLRAAGLWRQAERLAAGTERSLDEWYPVVSATAALLGVEPLPSGAVGAIAGWLPRAAGRPAPLTAPHVETVLAVLLDRDGELGDDQLRPLVPVAKAAGAVGQLQRIEVILVKRATSQLARGRPPSGPTPVATTEGIQVAVANCERLLGSADAATALTVLDWARETGLEPDPQLVERCGRDVIGPALTVMNRDRRIIRAGQAYPALARGLAAFITASGPDTARRLLRGVAGELLDSGDLRGYPNLRAMLLLEEVEAGRLPPVQALRELIELSPPSASPLRDENLLTGLWPRGLTTPGEAVQLLWLLDGDLRGTPALGLLDQALQPPRRIDNLDTWFDLCAQALDHPVCAQLPAATRLRLKALHGLGDMLEGARHAIKHGDLNEYQALEDRIEGLPGETRDLMRQYLAYLTLTAPRPVEELAACSEPVFYAICVQARARLDARPANHQLAARLFQSRHELRGGRTSRRARMLEDDVLAPTVPAWSRRDRGQVENILKRDAQQGTLRTLVDIRSRMVPRQQRQQNLSKEFKLWCKQNAGAATGAQGP
jgi:GTPase-associated protein 1, N-terminal domain type 2/GTPase-associated protein 1, C-terminal domain/GTPase-associated protein 1, middle domain